MNGVTNSSLPKTAFLQRYRDDEKNYTDCYSLYYSKTISMEAFVEAFYTGRAFKLERWLIATFTGHRSSQEQLNDLLSGRSNGFSAWTLEDRSENQLLMCDFQKRTRSWFMVEPEGDGTRLYFGSAVVPARYWNSIAEKFASLVFKILMPFHWAYSRILLGGAVRNLKKGT